MENLKIEKPGTLQNLAYKKIKTFLISGQLEFNQIYSANKFSEILGVSRTPIREALLQLAAEGLLVSYRGRGFKIKEFTKKEIKDFFETRKIIEAHVIKQIFDNLSSEDLATLDNCLNHMIAVCEHDTSDFLEADKSFHMDIVDWHGNRMLMAIMENIRDFISIFGKKALASPGRVQEVIEEHRNILHALHHKDKKRAVNAVLTHLNTTEKSLLEQG